MKQFFSVMLSKLPKIPSGNLNIYIKITLLFFSFTDLELIQFDHDPFLRLKKFCTKASKLDSLQTGR